jgi:hypothetical protein
VSLNSSQFGDSLATKFDIVGYHLNKGGDPQNETS